MIKLIGYSAGGVEVGDVLTDSRIEGTVLATKTDLSSITIYTDRGQRTFGRMVPLFSVNRPS